MFQSTKLFDGFSVVFRQAKATGTHCEYLHGYGISFKIWFEGELDERNWVWDFGGIRRAQSSIDGLSAKGWINHMFDHTMLVARDDPKLDTLLQLDKSGLAQVRVVEATGAEQFARLIYRKLNPFVLEETQGRVRILKVEFRENHHNAAIYHP